MKRALFLRCVTAVVLAAAGAQVVPVEGLQSPSMRDGAASIPAETARRIDVVFAARDNAQSPGCALGVSQHGNLVYSRGYGMSNLEYDIPITPDSIFDVGSVSKQFTAFSIALLASEGKLALDDDVRRYLPEVPDFGQRIAIRHLLTHTSGLRDAYTLFGLAGWRVSDGNPGATFAASPLHEPITEDDVLRMTARQKSLDFTPGAEFRYNNGAYVLLAVIVRRVSGQSFPDFTAQRIFGPLGMRDTQFLDDLGTVVRRRTSAYQPTREGAWRIHLPVSPAVGAGNLYSSVGDLLKWQENFLGARVGGHALLGEMQAYSRLNDAQTMSYGLGLSLDVYRGLPTVGHGGDEFGYLSVVSRFPTQRLAIVVLCNGSTIYPRPLANQVADIVLGLEAPAPVDARTQASIGEPEMAALAGTYWNPVTEEVRRFGMRDGTLVAHGSPSALVPLGSGRFRVGAGPMELHFPPQKAGAARELHIPPPVFNAPFSCRSWSGGCGGPWSERAVFSRVTAPSLSATDLHAYAGEYRSDELSANFAVVVTPAGGLSVVREKVDPVPLTAISPDKFVGESLGSTVTFARAPSGNVTGLTIAAPSPRRVQFTRVRTAPAQGR